jgi:hypothetical protein
MAYKKIEPNEDNLTPWATWADRLTHRVMIKSGPILLPALTSEQAKELGQALIDNAWEIDAARPGVKEGGLGYEDD